MEPDAPPLLTTRFDDALVYASRLHRRQLRKGTATPYVSHLLVVAGLVLENSGSEDEAIAALLHDAAEDQGGEPTLREIERRFGAEVARIVEACSDALVTPKPPWRERKQTHLDHLAKADDSVLLVAAADKLHNARTMLADYRAHGELLWSRFKAGREDHLWYLGAMGAIFAAHARTRALGDELARTCDAIREVAVRASG